MIVYLQITTGYNLEDDRCECVALQDYKENEQVTIAYAVTTYAVVFIVCLASLCLYTFPVSAFGVTDIILLHNH